MPLDDKWDLRPIDPKTGRPRGMTKNRFEALEMFRQGDPDALLRDLGFSEEEVAASEAVILREIGELTKDPT